jgi:hypothetical protein
MESGMTSPRRYAYGPERFSAWLREKPEIDSIKEGLVVQDIDYCFQKYRTNIDRLGARDVQLMMFIELKCMDAIPNPSQHETLFFWHQLLQGQLGKKVKRLESKSEVSLWCFGVFVLRLPRFSPEESDHFHWGTLQADGQLQWRRGTVPELLRLLAFEIRPDTFQPTKTRRHHSSRNIEVMEQTPLGFPIWAIKRFHS